MKKAHALTKELKKHYPNIDYRGQLGICIKYIYASAVKGGQLTDEDIKKINLGAFKAFMFSKEQNNSDTETILYLDYEGNLVIDALHQRGAELDNSLIYLATYFHSEPLWRIVSPVLLNSITRDENKLFFETLQDAKDIQEKVTIKNIKKYYSPLEINEIFKFLFPKAYKMEFERQCIKLFQEYWSCILSNINKDYKIA